MRKLVLYFLFGCPFFSLCAQDLSPKEFDSVRRTLGARLSDTSRINALVFLADGFIRRPGEEKSDLDSAAAYLSRARGLNAQIGDHSRLGYITLIDSYLWQERGNSDTARKLRLRALRMLQAQNDKYLLGRAYYALSETYANDRTDQLTERIRLTDSAATAYRRAGMAERQAFSLKSLADLHLTSGEITKCLAECDTCLQIYSILHFPWVQPIYDLIGTAYYKLGDSQKALSNALRALEICKQLHDSTMQRCQIEFNLSSVFLLIPDTPRAIEHLSTAWTVALLHHDRSNCYLVASVLVRIYAMAGNPGKGLHILEDLQQNFAPPTSITDRFTYARCYVYTYTALKAYGKAQPYIDELLALSKTPGILTELFCGVYLTVIRTYLTAGEYDAASRCLPVLEQAAQINQLAKYRKWASLFAFQLDTARGHYASAIAHLTEYDRIRDSLSGVAQTSQIQQLNTAYETSEKEKHIQALQSEQQLQQHALAAANQLRNFAMGGVILSLITIVIGFSRFRLKQEKNKQLEAKQRDLERTQAQLSGQNVELSRLLSENEWLLREVHHRVKNNLQLVKNLLDAQFTYLKEESAQNALRESQHRVQAMSLIHQKLYGSTNVSTIYMPEYIQELIEYLEGSFAMPYRIYFRREIEIQHLDVTQAIPVGLILNELITNALKHAFPRTEAPEITIRLFQSQPDTIVLQVEDNGIGLPKEFGLAGSRSFGIRLVNGLTEDLGGTIVIDGENGTSVRVRFPYAADVRGGNNGKSLRQNAKAVYEIS